MTRSRTAIDYSRRFDRVMAHMAEHLGQALELSALAEIANFSPFHFHRIYRSMTGATVAGTLRRLRLHRAAGDLVMGQRAVAAITRRAGHGSVAAFTRSFGAAYGVTPARYRRQGRLVPSDASASDQEIPVRNISISGRLRLRLAALAHRGSYMEIGTTPADRPCFEEYVNNPRRLPPAEWLTDICLSLREKQKPPPSVMAGHDAAIHACVASGRSVWMPAPSPGMTAGGGEGGYAACLSSSRRMASPITTVDTLAEPGDRMSAVRMPLARTRSTAVSISLASSCRSKE